MDTQTREFKIFITGRNKDERTISASISSEAPVERFGGKEILLHTEQAIDLSRSPLPLLTSHDAEQVPVGIVENLKIVGRKLRGVLRFGSSAKAKELWTDVRNGILSGLSIGYQVHETEPHGDAYHVTRWQPLEVSLVAVPADISVGIGRSLNLKKGDSKMNIERREQWGECASRANSIIETAKAEGRGMTESEASSFQGYADRFDELSLIIGEPGITVRELGVGGVMDRLAQPVNTPISRPDPGEFRDGSRITGGHNRAADRPWKSNGEFLQAVYRAGLPSGDVDVRLNRAVTGLGESVPSDGGFLVENDFGKDVARTIFENGDIISRCNQIEISRNSNSIKLPAIDETSRATGSRWGGITGYWLEEAGEKIASKPTFRQMELNLHKIIGLCYITDELLSDSGVLEKILVQGFTDELNFMLQDSIFNGTGVGQCLGIMNSGGLVTVDKLSGQAANSFELQNALDMWSAMPGPSRKNAIWCISQNVEPALYTMSLSVGTGGSPCFMPGGQASSEPFSTLFGRPIVPVESCQTLGTTGDILLVDFSQYILAKKGGIQRDMSIHIRYQYDESCMRMVLRADGQPNIASSITSFKGAVEMSPFIALQTRS
jgi:HK97 family phage major capsid protein/HK97 family phage prohead protease